MGLVAKLKGDPDFKPLEYRPHFIGALIRMEKFAVVGDPAVTYRLGDGRALLNRSRSTPPAARTPEACASAGSS